MNILADSGADPWELRSVYAALYRFRLLTLEMDVRADPTDLAQDPTLTALRAIVARTDAKSLPMSGSLLGDPGPDGRTP